MSEEAEVLAPENQNMGEPAEQTSEAATETNETEIAEAKEPEKKSNVQNRINQLTREKHEERRQREQLEKRLAELEANQQPEPIKTPKEDDFENYDDYLNAQGDYLAAKAAEKIQADQQAQQQHKLEQEQRAESEKRAAAFAERINSEMTQYEGFMEKVNDPVFVDISMKMNPELISLIQESDKATALTYHLANNLDDADNLTRLNPIKAARELALIEARLEIPQPKKISDAPDPVEPIGGNETVVKDPDKMPIDEWMEWRRNQKYSR